MRPTRVTQTGAGTSAPVIVDIYGRAQVQLQVAVVGTVNYTVQQTVDNLWDTAITPTWLEHPDPNIIGATTSQQSSCAQPPFALRIVVNSGTGSATLTVISSTTD